MNRSLDWLNSAENDLEWGEYSFKSGFYSQTCYSVPFLERAKDFFDLLDIAPAIDILVYTPEEFQKLTENPSVGFWTSVVREMKKVI